MGTKSYRTGEPYRTKYIGDARPRPYAWNNRSTLMVSFVAALIVLLGAPKVAKMTLKLLQLDPATASAQVSPQR
jgi:hypothetical protein